MANDDEKRGWLKFMGYRELLALGAIAFVPLIILGKPIPRQEQDIPKDPDQTLDIPKDNE